MTDTTLFGGAAVMGLLATCLGHIRVLALKAISFAVVRVKVHHPLCVSLGGYCYRNFRRSPFGLITFTSDELYVRPAKRYQRVGFETPGREPMVFWKGWRPLLLSALPSNVANGVSEGNSVTLTTLRGLFDLEALVVAALHDHNDIDHRRNEEASARCKRFYVNRFAGSFQELTSDSGGRPPAQPLRAGTQEAGGASLYNDRILHWCREQIGPELAEGLAMAALAFPPEIEVLVKELRHWQASEDWYRLRGIPWRRGWLLHGRPGTGKTSLVRAIGQDLDLPICVFDLGSMNNREMLSYWKQALNQTPCIALFEDFDAVFDGRTNKVAPDGGLTFDCFLNCLSGIENANGVFVIVTTNRVESLDEAIGIPVAGQDGTMISSRPGRVDRALELKGMNETCRRQVAERILAECPEHIERLVADGHDDTGAQFSERCSQVALANHWESMRPQPPSERPINPPTPVETPTPDVFGYDKSRLSGAIQAFN